MDEAEALSQTMIKVFSEAEMESSKARASNYLANIYSWKGELDKSIQSYDLAISIFRTQNEKWAECDSIFDKAEVLIFQGRFDDAFEELKVGMSIAKSINNKDSMASYHACLAGWHSRRDEDILALESMEKAVSLVDEFAKEIYLSEDAKIEQKSRYLAHSSVLANWNGRTVEAESLLFEAVRVDGKTAHPLNRIYRMYNLAVINYNRRDYARARTYAEDALRLSKEFGSLPYFQSLLLLSSIEIESSKFDVAENYINMAKNLLKDKSAKYLFESLNTSAAMYYSRKRNYVEATIYLKQSRELCLEMGLRYRAAKYGNYIFQFELQP